MTKLMVDPDGWRDDQGLIKDCRLILQSATAFPRKYAEALLNAFEKLQLKDTF